MQADPAWMLDIAFFWTLKLSLWLAGGMSAVTDGEFLSLSLFWQAAS